MIKTAIEKIVDKCDLTYEESYRVIDEIMSGKTSEVQNAAFLAALSTKSTKAETIDEITGCAAAMRDHATPFYYDQPLLEIVGTGGDRAGSFNISTASALVLASGGVKVAKHGNRAASSQCGAADCLEALGVNINQEPDLARTLLDEANFCFFFAQKYHTSMKYVGSIRKELGIRTVFNILGPLTNPARPTMQLLGVYDESLVVPLAEVLMKLGCERGMVVYGKDRLDEIAVSSETVVCAFDAGTMSTFEISPEDLGLKRADTSEIAGGTPTRNAEIVRAIFEGKRGSRRDAVLANAAAGFYCARAVDSLVEGVALAEQLIDSGAARATLKRVVELSQKGH